MNQTPVFPDDAETPPPALVPVMMDQQQATSTRAVPRDVMFPDDAETPSPRSVQVMLRRASADIQGVRRDLMQDFEASQVPNPTAPLPPQVQAAAEDMKCCICLGQYPYITSISVYIALLL